MKKSTHLLRKLHKRLSRILRRKQIPHREQEQKQLNRGPDGVILVAGFDVAEEDGGTGDTVELVGEGVEVVEEVLLGFVEVHYCISFSLLSFLFAVLKGGFGWVPG